MSSYDPLPEKLPSINMLGQQENDHNYNQDNAFSNFAHHSELYASNGSNHITSDMSLDLYHQQHLSPPLTPAVSPSNMMDPAQFKRKYSVDVGTFGFNARPTMMHDQDYRRSSYSNMSVDGNVQQQQDHSLQHGIHHHNQQLNYYQPPAHHDNSYLIGDSPLLSGDTDNAVSAAHDSMSIINGDTTKLNKRTRLAQHYQQGPNAPHKHVCKFSECGWSFKRYEHLKRHMLVHTGERPHVCAFPGCGKSFSRSDNFHAHYRTHTKKQAGGGENQTPNGRRNSKKSNGDVYLPMSASPSSSSSSSSTQQDLIHGYGSSQSFGFNNKSFEMPYQDVYDQRSFTSELQDQYSAMASPQPYMRVGMSSHSDVSSLLNHDQSPTMFTSMAPMYDLRGDYTGFHSTTGMPPPPSSPISSPSTLVGTVNKKQRKYRLSHSNDDAATDSSMQQKSHICPMAQCQRRFKRLEHLKRHMRIHTLERPFACTFPKCHKHFSRSDNLSQHMKTHQHRTAQDKRRKSSTATMASSSSSTTSSVSPRSLMDDFTSTNSQSTNTMSSLPSCWTLSESVGR